jgi:hypothetical protein
MRLRVDRWRLSMSRRPHWGKKLSIAWGKLEKAYQALLSTIKALREADASLLDGVQSALVDYLDAAR